MTSPSQPLGEKFESLDNCEFHQWAVQTFLWLTHENPDGKGLVFESFADPSSLLTHEGPKTGYPGRDPNTPLVMLARKAKDSATVDSGNIFQAGPGEEILVDGNGQVVYYSNHLNEEFWKLVTDKELWKLDKLENITPCLNFKVNTLELKAAWRVAELDGETLIPRAKDRFYVIDTEIHPVIFTEHGVVEDSTVTKKAKMALVSLHVVGVVRDHPEFIWATFEHNENAPDCGNLDAPGDWSFYHGADNTAFNEFNGTNPREPANVCRSNPMGRGKPDNTKNITILDTRMGEETKGTVWANYRYMGAIWTTDDFIPDDNPVIDNLDADNGDFRGSMALANTAMETFKQDENCFTCHNAGAEYVTVDGKAVRVGPKHLNLSHFVVNYHAVELARAAKIP
ncbi:Cytochrome c family protein [Enhygromyxa salina]|uniref:Cytochrome c family protein n=1 Tax=Enhygromyxa salina TaxID=215803 RepID=A0A0C2CZI8_9BACT|nr:hypothetical protein [Enhygromyxa salina]KIG13272.1 Cytochrome c family protein [Enhygromyxa salina]